jgi:hypothetical protein
MSTNTKLKVAGHGGLGLVAFLAMACGDDDASGVASMSGSATDGTTATDTEAASASASNGDSAGSASATSGGTTPDDTDDADDADDAETGSTGTNEDDSTTGDGSTGDDNGDADPTGNDDGPPEVCEAPGNLIPCDADTTDPFQAIGLNCPGGADEAIPIYNQSFTSADAEAWAVARQLGTYVDPITNHPLWSATEGEQFLFISSGRIVEPDANGVIVQTYRSVTNGNPNQPLPAPMSAAYGSNNGQGGTPFVNCDLTNDCSDSLQTQWQLGGSLARDLLWFQFELQVPNGTHGFTFDFAYFSVEFPTWIGSSFNDMFVVWSNSETYTGNLCFVDDEPCTVTALGVSSQNPQQQYKAGAPQLAGTGFDNNGGTGWFEAKASAQPGETLQLTWAVFDMGDTILDTAVIIDNFQWDCEGCVPSEVDPCGITPIPM